jgi:predicted RNase H-like HicB family nuclease
MLNPMTTNSDTITPPPSTKHSYEVLIEHQPEGQVSATLLGWQDCQVQGATKEEALNKLRHLLTTRLQNTEIVSLDIEIPNSEHPWMKFAGMFKDDPDFEDVLADIKAYRREVDEELSEYYRQLDAEEEN